MSTPEPVQVHGLVAVHSPGQLCVHTRCRPYEDAERPIDTECGAPACALLVDKAGTLTPGTWCTVAGSIDAEVANGTRAPIIDVEKITSYPSDSRDYWDQLGPHHGGWGLVELSDVFHHRTTHAGPQPGPGGRPGLIDKLEKQSRLIESSGLFDDAFSGGVSFIKGHGYANSVGIAIVTNRMREWLNSTTAEVVLTPIVQRRV